MSHKSTPLNFDAYSRHDVSHPDGLSLMLTVEGESVVDVVTSLSSDAPFLEKESEHLSYEQGGMRLLRHYRDLSLFHPLVYAWMLGIERLFECVPSPLLMYRRMILSELDRIVTHGRNFEELAGLLVFDAARGSIRTICQQILECARVLHTPDMLIRYPFFLPLDRPAVQASLPRLHQCTMRLIDTVSSLLASPLVEDRTTYLGTLSQRSAIDFGLGGPVLRACGTENDGRKYQAYDDYQSLTFDIPLRTRGDCLDRYRVRLEDMQQSARILLQCLERIKEMETSLCDEEGANQPLYRMESPTVFVDMIHHMISGGTVPAGDLYCSVEGPRGEAGIFWRSAGEASPYRVHFRTPALALLNVLPLLLKESKVGNVPLILNSLDIKMHDIIR